MNYSDDIIKALFRVQGIPLIVPSNSLLYEAGSKSVNVYLIESGMVVLHTTSAKSDTIVLQPNALLGLREALLSIPYSDTALTMGQTALLKLDREFFISLMQKNPSSRVAFIRHFFTRTTDQQRIAYE